MSLRSVSGAAMSFSVVAGLSCGQVILVEVERRIFCRDAVSAAPPCPSVVAGLSGGQVILVVVKRRFFVSLRSDSVAAMSFSAVACLSCGQVILIEVKRKFFCCHAVSMVSPRHFQLLLFWVAAMSFS